MSALENRATRPPGTRDACPTKLSQNRVAIVGQPSRLPGGRGN